MNRIYFLIILISFALFISELPGQSIPPRLRLGVVGLTHSHVHGILGRPDRGDIKIDLCANEKCGAVHLDPGELENLLKDEKAIHGIRKSFLSVFSK